MALPDLRRFPGAQNKKAAAGTFRRDRLSAPIELDPRQAGTFDFGPQVTVCYTLLHRARPRHEALDSSQRKRPQNGESGRPLGARFAKPNSLGQGLFPYRRAAPLRRALR